jgi:hypothetical protein
MGVRSPLRNRFTNDRFFGCSSAWQRFLATATALRADRADFQLAWARQLAAIGAQRPRRTGGATALRQLSGVSAS